MVSVDRALLEQALHSLDDLFYVFDIEDDLLFWNDRMIEVTGYTDEEIAEMGPTDFFPAGHRDRIAESVEWALESGDTTVEADLLTKDGRRIPHEFSGKRLVDESGELVGFTGIGRDITERREHERRLQEQTRQFQGVLDSVEAAIWIRDLDSRYRLLNRNGRDLLGIDSETTIEGKHPSELFSKEMADQFVEGDQRSIEGEVPIEFEETVETTKGTRTYLTRITPLYNDGELFATCGVASDITDLKRSQRDVQRVNDRLEEFVSIVSHDLRNPLNVAQGQLELVRASVDDEHLDAIERAHERMEALIEDLLTLAREGERVSEMERVSLETMVGSCWEVVDTVEATLVVETDLSIRADASRLQQLLENLIRNAVEHAGTDVTVTVGSLPDGFFVEDDGPGIPSDAGEDVFEAGYSTSDSGTGFGLNIVKQVADAHGWSIRVGEGQAGGARFEFTGVDDSA